MAQAEAAQAVESCDECGQGGFATIGELVDHLKAHIAEWEAGEEARLRAEGPGGRGRGTRRRRRSMSRR